MRMGYRSQLTKVEKVRRIKELAQKTTIITKQKQNKQTKKENNRGIWDPQKHDGHNADSRG